MTCKFKWGGIGLVVLPDHRPSVVEDGKMRCIQCLEEMQLVTDGHSSLVWVVPLRIAEWP